jgi:GWxTD domain-containing protein
MRKTFRLPPGCRNCLAFLPIFFLFLSQLFAQEPPASDHLEIIFSQIQNPDSATAVFYEALEKLRDPIRAQPSSANEKSLQRLYIDLIDIINDAERARWKTLRTPDEKAEFIKRFWSGRDLTPATPVNERLVEHYTRLLHARDKFGYFDARGYDDRGMIYVQYGPPDDYVEDVIESNTVPLSSWVYQRHGAPVNFDFINAGYGYRLEAWLNKAVRTFTPISELFAMQTLVNKRVTLHPTYAQLSMEIERIIEEEVRRKPPSNLRIRQILDRTVNVHATEVYKLQAQAPKTYSDVLTTIDALPCALHLAKFKGKNQKLDLVASYGFAPADLKGKTDTLQVRIVAAVRDSSLGFYASRDTTCTFRPRTPQPVEAFVAATTYSLPPSKYYFLLDINNPHGKQRGLRDFSVVLGRYPDGVLHLSTAIFASQVVPASDSLAPKQSLRRHDLAMTPYPFSTIKRDQRIFLYLEIYDLKRDESGETFYEVQYEVNAPEKKGLPSLLASLNPFSKSRGSISVIDTRRGKATTEPTYLQLDFSQLRGGNYDLIVRVTDKVAKITKESKLEFELE